MRIRSAPLPAESLPAESLPAIGVVEELPTIEFISYQATQQAPAGHRYQADELVLKLKLLAMLDLLAPSCLSEVAPILVDVQCGPSLVV